MICLKQNFLSTTQFGGSFPRMSLATIGLRRPTLMASGTHYCSFSCPRLTSLFSLSNARVTSDRVWARLLAIRFALLKYADCARCNQWRTQKILLGDSFKWHTVVICIWCALFVTSQFAVIFMFSKQCFGAVCWRNVHIIRHANPLFYGLLHRIQTISALS